MRNFALDRGLTLEVKEAESGENALELLKSAPFDLIFADWEMPGMSGLDFVKEIKTLGRCAEIPVIMVTGEAQKSKCMEALTAGVSDYLIKPVSRLAFEEKVLKIVVQLTNKKRL